MAKYHQVQKVIAQWIKKHKPADKGAQLPVVMSKKKWQERKEQYGNGSILVMTYDGGFAYDLINGEFDWEAHTELVNALADIGTYFEPMYSWCFAVYER